MVTHNINVSSEIGQLKKVLVHSPDGGLGNVPTAKIKDWLYDDIVDVRKIQEEYSRFLILLLLFLDPALLYDDKGKLVFGKGITRSRMVGEMKAFETNPEKPNYFGYIKKDISDLVVLDTQFLLQKQEHPLKKTT